MRPAAQTQQSSGVACTPGHSTSAPKVLRLPEGPTSTTNPSPCLADEDPATVVALRSLDGRYLSRCR